VHSLLDLQPKTIRDTAHMGERALLSRFEKVGLNGTGEIL